MFEVLLTNRNGCCREKYVGFIWPALDESTDRERKHAFVVAGYLARQRDWTEAERKWMLRLDKEEIKYFSSSECMSLSGEFKRFRDNDKYPRPEGRLAANKIRDDLLEIMKKEQVAGFALGLRLKEHRAMQKSSRARKVLPPDPYENMYTMMMIVIVGELEDEYRAGLFPARETVAFLCDAHDKSVNIKNLYDELKRHNPGCAPWMGSLSYMDNEQSPALQAADMLASQCKDVLVEETTKPPGKRPLGDTFKQRVGGHVSLRVFDMATLKMLVDANLPRKGKPGIYSTQQLTMFKDTVLAKNGDKNR
ncbi:MAG TPA: hypothetical protein VGH51_02345 [Candidatus Angelobacter sp.]